MLLSVGMSSQSKHLAPWLILENSTQEREATGPDGKQHESVCEHTHRERLYF